MPLLCVIVTLIFTLPVTVAFGQAFTIDSVRHDTATAFGVVAGPALIYAPAHRNPFTVSKIDRRDIDNVPEPTIEPLMNTIPGMWMQNGALNTNRISIRGVGYREPFATTGIKIYLDEIPLTNGAGESSIEDIHPHLLAGIDVWRGPASALWGSGLGGMIHLKTGFDDVDHVSSGIQLGSFNRLRFDQNASFRYGENQKNGTMLHYQFLSDDGYRDNNAYSKHSLTWLQQIAAGENLLISSFLHGIKLKAFIPSSINENDYINEPHKAAVTWDAVDGNEDYYKWIAGLNFLFSGNKNWIYRGSLYGTIFDSDEVRPFNILAESNTSYGMRHRLSLPVFQTGHLNFGIEYFSETYSFTTFETKEGGIPGVQLSADQEDRKYLNGFAQAEFDLNEDWIVFGGLHMARNHLNNQHQRSHLPVHIYPTAGLSYQIFPSLVFSGSVSRGYTNLRLSDLLDSEGMIADNIKPESGWSKEISALFGNYQAAYIKAGYYHMNVENSLITIRIADDIFEKANIGSAIHEGVEVEYAGLIGKNLSFTGAYTYSSLKSIDVIEGKNLPGAPAHKTSNSMTYTFLSNASLTVNHQYVGKVFLNDANSVFDDGYHLVNSVLMYKFHIRNKWELTCRANVHNILDEHYASMFQINAPSTSGGAPRYYYPGKPRSFYASVNLRFKL